MQVNAINSVSSLNFEGKSKKSQKKSLENINPNMDAPLSKDTVRGLRNLVYGLMLVGAAAGSGAGLTSCVEAKSSAEASAFATVIHVGGCDHHCKHDTTYINNTDTIVDTIIKPVYVKEYPFALGDSLINQGVNIGVPVEGPIPNGSNDVIFVASKAFDRYDQKLYVTNIDSVNTNKNQLSLITKITNYENGTDNPEVSWQKSYVTDVPGKGIRIDRYVANTKNEPLPHEWEYSCAEIRSNGGRGNKPGVNTVYDKFGTMVWQGEFKKGEEAGAFQYSQIVVDPETGDIYYDEDGNPEIADYNFNQAKIWSEYVEYKNIPNPDFGKLD